MRRAARRDGNHADLRKAWEDIGGSWCDIAPDVKGKPDAVVGWRGVDRLIEVKRPDAAKARKRAAHQLEWHAKWRGAPVAIVETVQDLLALFP